MASWTFAVDRDDLSRTTVVDGPEVEAGEGAAVLRVDRVGVTANNVTYAVLGESFRYWRFFPPEGRGLESGWGLVPLWGFADVVSSTVAGVEPGQRVYGYLPPAGQLVVRPERVDATGFRDGSPHRADLPSPYNAYRLTTGDPAYRADEEDLLVLFRPLFFTSFMLADYLADNGFFGATTLVLSSASSKTAYATAFELRGQGPRLVGLTSPGNQRFTESLGCYDDVLTYAQVETLTPVPTAYLDLAGAPSTRHALREHLGDHLVRDVAVGLTYQVPNSEAAGEFFFAPVQMRKRGADWGRDELDRRFGAAWRRFADALGGRVDIRVGHGPEALRTAWLAAVAGRVPAQVGQVIAL
ncbi:DUF2855 family protein [Asanoa iriomotensis]|uniref:DUF2855 family protein n=1 Tax=Asanoa iriomotensis TaxID=234613 RepID=A0ABQ4BWM6_9ACTN|nr:DUF2855 family protein [Asanoa iriomotensis]GIF54934.1 hypothetical protein Air01nite_10290 [Asanoa iriomotensis]